MGRPLIVNESIARMRNEGLGIRNEGGGFAANIYGAMPESGIQVTSPQSLATHPCFHTSGLWWRLRCILADGIPVSSAFPSRGRCPEGADRALAA